MSVLDNSKLIAEFVPAKYDGDTFIYTEMLDRGKRKGNNGQRLLKTFYHRSRDEFWEQWPTIQKLCDLALVRACTRLAPRSYKRVGKEHVRLVVEAALTENWDGMKTLYNRACGITEPNQKLWLWDVDQVNDVSAALGRWLELHATPQDKSPILVATVPSKKALHYISRPFDVTRLNEAPPAGLGLEMAFRVHEAITCHKNNPTNLYIPDGAD